MLPNDYQERSLDHSLQLNQLVVEMEEMVIDLQDIHPKQYFSYKNHIQ